jgi:hypothetical protein
MLEGVRETALSTIEKIDEIQDVHREMHGELRSIPPGGANADRLDVLFEQPFSLSCNNASCKGIS